MKASVHTHRTEAEPEVSNDIGASILCLSRPENKKKY